MSILDALVRLVFVLVYHKIFCHFIDCSREKYTWYVWCVLQLSILNLMQWCLNFWNVQRSANIFYRTKRKIDSCFYAVGSMMFEKIMSFQRGFMQFISEVISADTLEIKRKNNKDERQRKIWHVYFNTNEHICDGVGAKAKTNRSTVISFSIMWMWIFIVSKRHKKEKQNVVLWSHWWLFMR